MADRRIRVPSDKMGVVERLVASDSTTGPFRLQADVLAFAAALGAAREVSKPFEESPKEPIRQEVFERHGYGTLMGMLAVNKEQSPSLLADTDEMDDRRATIFENYANAGLEILREELKGAVDDTEVVLMLLTKERRAEDEEEDEDFDLRSILQED